MSKKIRNLLMSKKPIYRQNNSIKENKHQNEQDKQNSVSLLGNTNQIEQTAEDQIASEEEQPTEYTFKDYAGLLILILIFLFFIGLIVYSFFTDFFFSTINLASSFPGTVVNLPCSQKLRKLLSYNKRAKNIEEFIKGFSLFLRAKCFKTFLKWISTLIRDRIFSNLFFYAIYYLIIYYFIGDGSTVFNSCFITASVSLCT